MSKFPASLFPIETPDEADEWQFLGCVPSAMNEAIAYFSRELVHDDVFGHDSVTNPDNWSIVATDPRTPSDVDPTRYFVPDGVSVPTFQPEVARAYIDEDDPMQVHVVCNTPLESRVIFELTVSTAVRGQACEELVGPGTRSFQGLYRGIGSGPRYVQLDSYRDFDLRFFPADPRQPEGTWRYDTTGDIGIQTAAESLKKRLYRRLMTSPGGFSHLGNGYGMNAGIKQIVRSGELQRLANRAAEQARLEPDVIAASAEATLKFSAAGSAIVELTIRAIREDHREFRFVFEPPIGGPIAA